MAERRAHAVNEKERTKDIKIEEDVDFSSMFLSEHVLSGLHAAGFVRPSPIQLAAIPLGRCGLDLVVQAKSGTGKTCVFVVVALEMISVTALTTQVLVIAPTREVAVQITQVFSAVASSMPGLRAATFIGGIRLDEDRAKLKCCHIAVGTPGRITQLVDLGLLKLDNVRLFVLDEADQMLSGQFADTVVQLATALPLNKQVLALSATYTEEVAKVAESLMRSASHVRLGRECPSLLGVGQFAMLMPYHHRQHHIQETKFTQLLAILSSVTFNQCLVFSNSQLRAESICNKLRASGWPTSHLTGGQKQSDRLAALEALCSYKCRVLVSTDLAARGLDSEHVNLVVNLDLPQLPSTYLHRVGRAGRFGSRGAAITLVTEGEEWQAMRAITTLANVKVKLLDNEWPSTLTQKETEGSEEVEFLPEEEVAKWLQTNSTSHKQKSSNTNSTSQRHESSTQQYDKTRNRKNKQDLKESSTKQRGVDVNGKDNTSSEGSEVESEDSGKENRKNNPQAIILASKSKCKTNEGRETAKSKSRMKTKTRENEVLQETSSNTEKISLLVNQNKTDKNKVMQEPAPIMAEESPTGNQINHTESEICQEAQTNTEKTPLIFKDKTDDEMLEETARKSETRSLRSKRDNMEKVVYNRVSHTMRVNSVGTLMKRLNQKGGCEGTKQGTLCGDDDDSDEDVKNATKAAELKKKISKMEDDNIKVVKLLQGLNFTPPSVTCSYADILSDIQEKYDKAVVTTEDDAHVVTIPPIPNQLEPTEDDLRALESYCKTMHENVEQRSCETEKAWAGTKADISVALQMVIEGKDPVTLLGADKMRETTSAAQLDENTAVSDCNGCLQSPPETEVKSEISKNKASDNSHSQAKKGGKNSSLSNVESTSSIKLRGQVSVRKKLHKKLPLKHNGDDISSCGGEPEQQQSVLNCKSKETDASVKHRTRREKLVAERKHKKKHPVSGFLGDDAHGHHYNNSTQQEQQQWPGWGTVDSDRDPHFCSHYHHQQASGNSHAYQSHPVKSHANDYNRYNHYYQQQQHQSQEQQQYSSYHNNAEGDGVNDIYAGRNWTPEQPGSQEYPGQFPSNSHYPNYNQYSNHSHHPSYNQYPAAYNPYFTDDLPQRQNEYIKSACKFAAMMEYIQTMGRVSAAVAQDFYSRKAYTDKKHGSKH